MATRSSAPRTASRRPVPTPRSPRGEATRERIVEVAARVLRERGYAGVGVAEVMREAGLTHGGFYAHFESRDALLVAALERAGRESTLSFGRFLEAGQTLGFSRFRSLVEGYLADGLLAHPEKGCVIAAVGSEMARQPTTLCEAGAERVRRLILGVEGALPPGADRTQAPVIASTMVGALQLARALGANAQGRAMLAATRQALLSQYDQGDHDDVAGPPRSERVDAVRRGRAPS